MAETLDELGLRLEKGIRWLDANDPGGRFHIWFTSRIPPGSPMPAQDDATKKAYAEYHAARTLWERLDREYEKRGGYRQGGS
jgi:hypothetical protein